MLLSRLRADFDDLKGLSPAPDFNYEVTTFKSRDGANIRMTISSPHQKPKGLLDVVLNIHGGGWVAGDVDMASSNIFVSRANIIVFSVDYRLAPEYKFPTAPLDCYDALLWVHENARKYGGNPDRISLYGLSAGGNLAAVIGMMSYKFGGPKILKQVLDVPGLDFYANGQSYIQNFDSLVWNTKKQIFARSFYFNNHTEWADYRASPLFAGKDLISKQPETLLVVCSLDPFYDGGIKYHNELKAVGVESKLLRLEGIPHAGHRFPWPFFRHERTIFEQEVLNFLAK